MAILLLNKNIDELEVIVIIEDINRRAQYPRFLAVESIKDLKVYIVGNIGNLQDEIAEKLNGKFIE